MTQFDEFEKGLELCTLICGGASNECIRCRVLRPCGADY